jgi:hypothetical protein
MSSELSDRETYRKGRLGLNIAHFSKYHEQVKYSLKDNLQELKTERMDS